MTLPQEMVVRCEPNGQALTIPCTVCKDHYRAGDPEAVLYAVASDTPIGYMCPDCCELLKRRNAPAALAERVRERARVFDALADELETVDIGFSF